MGQGRTVRPRSAFRRGPHDARPCPGPARPGRPLDRSPTGAGTGRRRAARDPGPGRDLPAPGGAGRADLDPRPGPGLVEGRGRNPADQDAPRGRPGFDPVAPAGYRRPGLARNGGRGGAGDRSGLLVSPGRRRIRPVGDRGRAQRLVGPGQPPEPGAGGLRLGGRRRLPGERRGGAGRARLVPVRGRRRLAGPGLFPPRTARPRRLGQPPGPPARPRDRRGPAVRGGEGPDGGRPRPRA